MKNETCFKIFCNFSLLKLENVAIAMHATRDRPMPRQSLSEVDVHGVS